MESQGSRDSKPAEGLTKRISDAKNPFLETKNNKNKLPEIIIAAEKKLKIIRTTKNGKSRKKCYLLLTLDYLPPEINTNLYRWRFEIPQEMYTQLLSRNKKDDYAEIIIKL